MKNIHGLKFDTGFSDEAELRMKIRIQREEEEIRVNQFIEQAKNEGEKSCILPEVVSDWMRIQLEKSGIVVSDIRIANQLVQTKLEW